MALPVDVLRDTPPMTVELTLMNVQIQTSVTMERAQCVQQNNVTKLLLSFCLFRILMDRTLVSVMLATRDSTVRRTLMSVNQTLVQMVELAL